MAAGYRTGGQRLTTAPRAWAGADPRQAGTLSPAWARLIQDNIVSIRGWILFEKERLPRDNNPEAPGLVRKLAPGDRKARGLASVRKLRDAVVETRRIGDAVPGTGTDRRQYDVDRFIPWSFVVNDERWTLMPTTSFPDSAEDSGLPDLDAFFGHFARGQYIQHRAIRDSGRPPSGSGFAPAAGTNAIPYGQPKPSAGRGTPRLASGAS